MDFFNYLKETGEYQTYLFEPVKTRTLLLNSTTEKLADLNVRLALHHGFNKEAMVETLQAEWPAIDVKLTIAGVELTAQIERRKAGQFDIDFWYNFGAPYDPHVFINVVAKEGWGFRSPSQLANESGIGSASPGCARFYG